MTSGWPVNQASWAPGVHAFSGALVGGRGVTVAASCSTVSGQGQVEPCWLHHSPMGWRGSPPREWPAQALTGPCGGGAGWRDACHSCCTRSWGWASRFLLPVLQPQHLASLREAATLWGVLRGSLGHGHQLWRPSGLGHSQVDEPVTLPACVAFFLPVLPHFSSAPHEEVFLFQIEKSED